MNVVKKILSTIGILGLLFIGFIMLTDDGSKPAETPAKHESGTSVDDGQESGDSVDNEGYYTLVLEDGREVDILKPQTIFENQYKNLNAQREESIFSSKYYYDHADEEGVDVYVENVPNGEQTLKEMLKEPYAVGSIFHFDMKVTGGPSNITGRVSGYIQGDDSVGMMHVDMSYIGDEKNELMDGDIVPFDAVYGGLDNGSTPTFIALSMEVQ